MSLDEVSLLITQKLENLAERHDLESITRRSKAISALFPYAVSLVRVGQRRMADAISRTAGASKSGEFMWYRVKPFIATMFKKPNPPSLTWVLGLISPRVNWHSEPHDKNMAASRAAATPATSNPEVCWSVVDELLHIAFVDISRRGHKHSVERPEGTGEGITHQVRALGDDEILKSYLILALSLQGPVYGSPEGLAEILTLVREDFSGVGVGRHRKDLIERLAEMERLSQEWIRMIGGRGRGWNRDDFDHDGILKWTIGRYKKLRNVLLKVDKEAANTHPRTPLTGSHSTFMCSLPPLCP